MAGVMNKKPIRNGTHHHRNVRRTHSTLLILSVVFMLSIIPYHASADEMLRDPTRPPDALSSPRQIIQDKEDKQMEVVISSPRLQAVMISGNHRSAIISGRSVTVGEKIGHAQIIRINESEVVLKSGGESRTLRLFTHPSKQIKANNQHTAR